MGYSDLIYKLSTSCADISDLCFSVCNTIWITIPYTCCGVVSPLHVYVLYHIIRSSGQALGSSSMASAFGQGHWQKSLTNKEEAGTDMVLAIANVIT